MLDKILGIASDVLDPIRQLVDDVHTSEEERMDAKRRLMKLEGEMYRQALEAEKQNMQARSDIIKAEATGHSWLQRNWRPILMLTVVAIIANNYILAPYLGLLIGPEYKLVLDLPAELYTLMTVGVGGYIASRGAEKVAGMGGMKALRGQNDTTE